VTVDTAFRRCPSAVSHPRSERGKNERREKNAQLEKNKNPIGKLFFSNWEIKMGVFQLHVSVVHSTGKNIASLKNKLYYSTPSNLLSVSLNVDFVFEALKKPGFFLLWA
jgi:hypothetical protein